MGGVCLRNGNGWHGSIAGRAKPLFVVTLWPAGYLVWVGFVALTITAYQRLQNAEGTNRAADRSVGLLKSLHHGLALRKAGAVDRAQLDVTEALRARIQA